MTARLVLFALFLMAMVAMRSCLDGRWQAGEQMARPVAGGVMDSGSSQSAVAGEQR